MIFKKILHLKCHLFGIIGFRKLCRIQKCNYIQGVPFENQKLVSLPLKQEVEKNSFVCQKVTFIGYIRCPEFQKISLKNKEKKGGVP